MRGRKSDLFEKVYSLTRAIPKGRVSTYGALAFAAGRPRSARVVGFIMSVCPYSSKQVPCHRVIRSDGRIGGYGLEGIRRKARLLRREGVEVSDDFRIDIRRYYFADF